MRFDVSNNILPGPAAAAGKRQHDIAKGFKTKNMGMGNKGGESNGEVQWQKL
jgi:hypothetical protein